MVDLLPYLEEEAVYRRFNRQAAWDDPANTPAVETPLRLLQCPDWGREATPDPAWLTAYVGVAGLGADAAELPAGDPRSGVFGYDRRMAPADITDGTAATLLVLESARDNGAWSQGGQATVRGLDPAEQPYLGVGRQFGGTHFTENNLFRRGRSIGCNAAMADGSVRFLDEGIAPQVLQALVTAAGGEQITDDW
jgi:Protein of unknown function (DUF1559)